MSPSSDATNDTAPEQTEMFEEFPAADVNVSEGMPQGVSEFYGAIQEATVLALQSGAPFQQKHPAIDQSLNEILRYLELATMYMDRFVLYINNPQVLQKAKETIEDSLGEEKK